MENYSSKLYNVFCKTRLNTNYTPNQALQHTTYKTHIQRTAALLLTLFSIWSLSGAEAQAQNNVGIGTTTPNAKAILELNANNKGFLAPRMNTTFMNAIAPTATENALLIYNTDSACYHFYNGVAWKNLCQKGIDTAVINKAIKNYLGGVTFTTVINNMLVDSSVTNYAVINNAIVNNITIDSSVINYTTINNATINNLTVDSSTTNYAQVSQLQGGWGSMDSLQIGGQNILQTISDSIKSQAWLLKGNTNTNDSLNFLGTTDNHTLTFKVNDTLAGKIDHIFKNTFLGYKAGKYNTKAVSNVALGYNSLTNINTNPPVALPCPSKLINPKNSIGTFGIIDLCSFPYAEGNTATGYESLLLNNLGSYNTANGYQALYNDTTGIANTAIGAQSLYNNIGSFNTALGTHALFYNTTGTNNTAVGIASLFNNINGSENIAVGRSSLAANISGTGNVGIGTNAGNNGFNLGSNNIFIGYANPTANNLNNAIAIGNNARVGASNAMAIGGVGFDAIKVAIGKTIPDQELDVLGNIQLSGALMPAGNAGNTNEILVSQGAANAPQWQSGSTLGTTLNTVSWSLLGNNTTNPNTNFLGTTDNNSLRIRTNNTERMIVDSTGLIGIGISTPKTPLHIISHQPASTLHPYRVGILAASEGTDLGGRIGTLVASSVEAPRYFTHRANGTLANPLAVNANDILGSLHFFGYDGTIYTGAGQGGAVIYSLASENWNSTNRGAIITFQTTLNGTAFEQERMRIENTGNVGIGTTTPTAKLHTVGVGSSIFNNGLTVQSPNAVQSLDVLPGYVLTNSTPAGLQEDITMTLRTSGSLAGNLAFATGNDERMRLLANGNFGIGTTTPAFMLDVLTASSSESAAQFTSTGNVNVQLKGGASLHQFFRFFENNTGRWEVGNSSADNNKFYFNTTTGAGDIGAQMVIQQNGNVGIGTTSPAQKLQVFGSVLSQISTAQSALLSSDGNLELNRDITSPVPSTGGYVDLKTNFPEDFRTRLYFNNAVSSFGIITSTDGFATGAAERLTILASNGFTGIGTLTPTAKLEIQGDIKIVDGTQGANKVLTSDAAGKASWQAASSGGVPIGSIQAWAKSMPGTPALPVGWVECNGAVLSDVASPYNGQTIPNLNGTSRFLQGAATSGGTGGSATHSHTFTQTGVDYAPDASHFTDGSIADPSSNLPPFFNVVWIMRVK
jgi:hypothetical protein